MTEKPTFYSTVMLLYKSGETERRGTGGNELVAREPGKRQEAREVKPPGKGETYSRR